MYSHYSEYLSRTKKTKCKDGTERESVLVICALKVATRGHAFFKNGSVFLDKYYLLKTQESYLCKATFTRYDLSCTICMAY
jgi:hypothetical protein